MVSCAFLVYSFALVAVSHGTTTTSTTVPDENTTLAQQQDKLPIITSVNVSESSHYPQRIVGGRPISIREAPWQVALIVDRSFNCGGSVISKYWVLTAAHCTDSGTVFVVRAGTRYFKRGGQTRSITLIVRNGRYNPSTLNNDIAMLRVNRPFVFGRDLQPVRLPSPTSQLPNTFFVSGWGSISQNAANPRLGLRGVNLRLVPRATCARLYAASGGVPRTALCASAPGKDNCYGDSGSALVSNGVQYGIVSFGNACAQARFPGVYTDLRFERRWITQVARRFNGF